MAPGRKLYWPVLCLCLCQLFLYANTACAAEKKATEVEAKWSPSLTETLQQDIVKAKHYQNAGRHEQALQLLQEVQEALSRVRPADMQIYNSLLNAMGDALLVQGKWQEATDYIIQAANQAYSSGDSAIQAYTLNNLGNLLLLTGYLVQAERVYRQSMQLIRIHRLDVKLESYTTLNLLQLHIVKGNQTDILLHAEKLQKILRQMDAADHLPVLLSFIRLLIQTHPHYYPFDSRLHVLSSELLRQALKSAEVQEDIYALGYAHMYKGQWYEQKANYAQAAAHNRQAVFYAQQQGGDAQLMYQLYWQQGRILKQRNQHDAAINAYQRAMQLLHPLRQIMLSRHRSPFHIFQQDIKPVYLEYISLLLTQQSRIEPSFTQKEIKKAVEITPTKQTKTTSRQLLEEVKNTLELLKTAELQDYFQDDCAIAVEERVRSIDQIIDKNTAVIYPIILQDRLVVLLGLHDGTYYKHVVPVSAKELAEVTLQFRSNLQTRAHNRFMLQAQQLYQWIFQGMETTLTKAGIQTIVIVPDGILRTIPFAAFMRDEHFLAEEYQLTIVPGLSMTDTALRSVTTAKNISLVAGLSTGVQGFSPLPGVKNEVKDLQKILEHSQVLQNRDYSLKNLRIALKKTAFTTVHMATHGIFSGTPEESFLLTYHEKINMHQLEELLQLTQFRDQPIELLTLSACQTALGDEQAALGLAGIAVKAGARSALASLWFVDDEATALFMRAFYHQLSMPGITKAAAVQAAQYALLKQDRFWHPSYWSAFLLIGDWQ